MKRTFTILFYSLASALETPDEATLKNTSVEAADAGEALRLFAVEQPESVAVAVGLGDVDATIAAYLQTPTPYIPFLESMEDATIQTLVRNYASLMTNYKHIIHGDVFELYKKYKMEVQRRAALETPDAGEEEQT